MPTILLTPTCTEAGQRLDVYIAGATPDLSRSQVKRLIAENRVRVAGQPAGASTKVLAGAAISVTLPEPADPALQAEPLVVPLLYCDDHIVVVDKPHGLVMHPGAGQSARTLANQLIGRFPELASVGESDRPGVVHRLDKDTSGVLVVARTPAAYEWLVAQFAARAVEKSYLALVEGTPTVERGLIDAPVGRHPTRRTSMGVVRNGRPATTHFTVLETLGRYTLLNVAPGTGRTHQIRVHLAAAGLPVAGDTQYGRSTRDTGLRRMFLHAFTLGFLHPASREPVHFCAPLADDLVQALHYCGSAWVENRQVDPGSERP